MSRRLLFRPSLFAFAAAALVAACNSTDPVRPSAGRSHLVITAGVPIVVTSTSDNGPGSLREALANAVSGDQITFDPALAGQAIGLTSGPLVMTTDLSIDGPANGGVTLKALGQFRVVETRIQTQVLLRNMTITGGHGIGEGGGIRNSGVLYLFNMLVTGNTAHNGATVQPGSGGGVGGAADVQTTIVNSTITGNHAEAFGGGVQGRNVRIVNSTIANDTSRYGGGGITSLNLVLENSIVGDNHSIEGGSPNPDNCFTYANPITLVGRNLSTDTTCSAPGPQMIVAPLQLALLADNGGAAFSMVPLIGSPAIDGGVNCFEQIDQRNVARPQGGACDIGAVEFNAFLRLGLHHDASLAVNPATGIAVVTGSIDCPTSETFRLRVTLSQPQKARKVYVTVSASGDVLVTCSSTALWSVQLKPTSGGFVNGPAMVNVSAPSLPAGYLPASEQGTVSLYWGKK